MENGEKINDNNLNENINEAKSEGYNESIYLIDNPCSEKEDAIGFGVYVDNLINILSNTSAKMIGLISNYGSGKSTIINMVESRTEMSDEEIFFVKVN